MSTESYRAKRNLPQDMSIYDETKWIMKNTTSDKVRQKAKQLLEKLERLSAEVQQKRSEEWSSYVPSQS